MSQVMDEEIKRWTARRKSALVLEIIQGRTTVAEAARQFDLTPVESRAGSTKARPAWRTHCVPSPRMSASGTSGS